MFESDPENSNPLLSERKKRRQKGILHVAIKEAEDLPEMDPVSLTDAVVKCYLLPSRTASNKRKTEVLYMYVLCRLLRYTQYTHVHTCTDMYRHAHCVPV